MTQLRDRMLEELECRNYSPEPGCPVLLPRKLRGSELIVRPGGGHSVFEESPEDSNRIMLEWLGRHSLSTPRLRPPSCRCRQKNQGCRCHAAFVARNLRRNFDDDTKQKVSSGIRPEQFE